MCIDDVVIHLLGQGEYGIDEWVEIHVKVRKPTVNLRPLSNYDLAGKLECGRFG